MMMLQGHVVGWHGKRKSSFVPRVRAVGRYSSRCASLAFEASPPIVDGYLWLSLVVRQCNAVISVPMT